jgi:hypothetical protein
MNYRLLHRHICFIAASVLMLLLSAVGSSRAQIAANVGVFFEASLITHETRQGCPNILPPNVTGCKFVVKWAQVEPHKGVFDWTVITNQESHDITNYPLQIEILTGEAGTPNSTAVCNSFTPENGAPRCHEWLASAEGINMHMRSHTSGLASHIPPCTPTYDNYPGDPAYQTALAGLETAFHQYFARDPKIALVSINPMSELGHNMSLPTGVVNQKCPNGTTLTEYYNAAWNRIAMKHGCSSGNESCWRNLIVNAFKTMWAQQISILHDMNLSLWITPASTGGTGWPAVTGAGKFDGNNDPSGIQQRIFTYANANQPADGAYYVFNEGLGPTQFWGKIVDPWITGHPSATGGGAEIGTIYTGHGVGKAGCLDVCVAGVLCGAYMGATFEHIYTPDIENCPSVISKIVRAINGDTRLVCGNAVTCP